MVKTGLIVFDWYLVYRLDPTYLGLTDVPVFRDGPVWFLFTKSGNSADTVIPNYVIFFYEFFIQLLHILNNHLSTTYQEYWNDM